LLYAFPQLYEWSLKKLHGSDLKKRFDIISSVIGQGQVLDIACGTGMLAEYLDPQATYQGIDLNKRFLKYSEQKGLNVSRMDVFDFDQYPEVDTYVVCDLLHHIMPNHQKLLENIMAFGKNVIVCEPAVPNKSKLRRFVVRGILDNDFINPPRLDLDWYTEPELIQFYKDTLNPTDIIKVGEDIIAIKQVNQTAKTELEFSKPVGSVSSVSTNA